MVDERELSKYKVTELKAMLHEHGVIPKGLKADLIRQLADILNARERAVQETVAEQQQLIYQQRLAAGLEVQNQLAAALPIESTMDNYQAQALYQQQVQLQLQQQQLQQQQMQQQMQMAQQQQYEQNQADFQQALLQQQQAQEQFAHQQQLLQAAAAAAAVHPDNLLDEMYANNQQQHQQHQVGAEESSSSLGAYQPYEELVQEQPDQAAAVVGGGYVGEDYSGEEESSSASYGQQAEHQQQQQQFIDENTSQDVPSIASDTAYDLSAGAGGGCDVGQQEDSVDDSQEGQSSEQETYEPPMASYEEEDDQAAPGSDQAYAEEEYAEEEQEQEAEHHYAEHVGVPPEEEVVEEEEYQDQGAPEEEEEVGEDSSEAYAEGDTAPVMAEADDSSSDHAAQPEYASELDNNNTFEAVEAEVDQDISPPRAPQINGHESPKEAATEDVAALPDVIPVEPEADAVASEDEENEDTTATTFSQLSAEELAKMSKNARRKYKKKLRNKVKRLERDQVEAKKRALAELPINKVKDVMKKPPAEIEIKEEEITTGDDDDAMDMDIDDEDEAEEEKEKKRRLEEELRRQEEAVKEAEEAAKVAKAETNGQPEDDGEVPKIEIEYIPEEIPKDAVYLQFLKVFDKFNAVSADEASRLEAERIAEAHRNRDDRTKMLELKRPVEFDLKDDDEAGGDGSAGSKMSKRKLKAMTRMSIADLKQAVTHPELVEMHDVTARDPVLLLQLKSTRNTVPVPRHWCYKRKYLQGKRGFEKPPFKLPEFIRRTGIQEMREALAEKEDAKSLKSKMREKIRPKMGKIDIDYQKLHDAFFKWQTKPFMSMHGDLYYEGKEFETRLKDKKPGDLTTELRSALGMPTGPNATKCPPPWLIAMQRYGPPPSYPNLKIPGLNAPIPEGCSFGYHAGGWGKPPVDEYGRPLYGDVFGLSSAATDATLLEEEVDRSKWGEMESDEESEAEEEGGEEEDEDGDEEAGGLDRSGLVTPAAEGLVTPSGFSSVPAGIETPDMIELRKRKQAIEAEMESGENPALFTVIPEKKTDRYGKEMLGSMHVYDFASLSKTTSKTSSSSRHDGVDVALDPSELEAGALDSNQMAAKYEQSMRQNTGGNPHEDFSDMVAEYAASKQKRRKGGDQTDSSGKSGGRDKAKKYQFKF